VSVYAYAALAGPRDDSSPPLHAFGEPVRSVSAGGLVLAVGDLPVTPLATVASLQQHDDVLRALALRFEAVLPFRFATVCADIGVLGVAVRARHRALAEALDRVRSREQMTVHIRADASSRRPASRPAATGPGSAYLLGRAAARARAPSNAALECLLGRLATLTRAEIVERRDGESPCATVCHLIDRGASESYRALALEAARHAALRARVTGPWPPYAFASVPEGRW